MSKILEQVNSPADLKNIKIEKLGQLCSEIRALIIDVVSKNGGHLASSLGAVELTVALHYVFNPPRDKIIWDVGHQAYAHKILTGRREQFHTIRKKDGLSGFPKPSESKYDAFTAGHASTSISAASGMAAARDIKKEKYDVVAVIGDGALTGGMSFEAMNNIGDTGTKLMVILNGNEMAISPSVGAMSKYLNKIITSPLYNTLKNDIESIVDKIPAVGKKMLSAAHRVEEAVKSLIIPGAFFEELGFTYFGPIDGHNVPLLIKTIKNVNKGIPGPVIVHVVTKKGKGYEISEKHPELFHGTSPFKIETGESLKKNSTPTFTEVFGDELVKLASKDTRIVAITAAMCLGAGLTKFRKKFPERFFDVGIAEQHAVTFAGGLAASGLKPVVAVYSTFLQRAIDQIFHDICLMNLPVVFALDRAGLVGEDGPTHHGVFDITYLSMIPNLAVLSPSNGSALRALLKSAIDSDNPCAIRYPKGSIPKKTDFSKIKYEIGKWELVENGEDGYILAAGSVVNPASETIKILKRQGIDLSLVDCYSVKPLDTEMLGKILKQNKPVITLEENVERGGFGSYISEVSLSLGFDNPIKHIALGDEFIQHASHAELYNITGLDAEGIAQKVKEILKSR